jgi:hypothetical protein
MAALKAVPPAETPEQTPLDTLRAWQDAQALLREEVTTLETGSDLAGLDRLAIARVKLEHVTSKLPALEEEAQDWERTQRLMAARERVSPLWAAQAQRKVEARATLAAACKDITDALELFRLAHDTQLHLFDQIGVRRGTYGNLFSQLLQAFHSAVSLQGDFREWQTRLRDFDAPGCSSIPPSQEIM